jgi:hypothetical protein
MKKSAKQFVAILLLVCCYYTSIAQPDFSEDPYFSSTITREIGFSIGAMNCLTDLGGNKGAGKKFIKDLNVGSTAPAASIFFSTFYKNALGLRTELTWGVVKANDKVLEKIKNNSGGRFERNLNFRSRIFEVTLAAEIHPLYFKNFTTPNELPRISPYVTGGIGLFSFNPQTKINGIVVDLQPLRTEGQGFAEYSDRKMYKLKQLNFPVGAGVKYKLSSFINISAECIYRILRTDYLDDVSTGYIDKNLFANYLSPEATILAQQLYNRQSEINPAHTTNIGDIRGNPKNNDAFFSVNIKLAVTF